MTEKEAIKELLDEADDFRRYLEVSENKFATDVLGIDKAVWSKMKRGAYRITSKQFKRLMEVLCVEMNISYSLTKTNQEHLIMEKRDVKKKMLENKIAKLQDKLAELTEES